MRHLKLTAIPLAIVGVVFLFFGLIWQGAVQLGVALALLALAAAVWRTTSGAAPLSEI